MRKDELESLASILPKDDAGKIHLPIVLIRRRDMGPGAFTILGDKPEAYAVSRMLSRFDGDFEEYRAKSGPELVVYKPQVSELTRKFHSLIVIGFGVSEDTQ